MTQEPLISAGGKHFHSQHPHNNLLTATNASTTSGLTPSISDRPAAAITVLDASSGNSRTLIDLNDRLTKQIEHNLSLFENLN
jgi:hypothetical protein